MSHIKFDYSKVLGKFVAPHEVDYMQAQVTACLLYTSNQAFQMLISNFHLVFEG